MRFKESKWEEFLDGFHYICSALDAYNAGEKWGYWEFWETINTGWYSMYIFPHDDWYLPTISKERRMRLAQKPETIYLSAEDFDALMERIENPPPPTPEFIALINRKAPWDEEQCNLDT